MKHLVLEGCDRSGKDTLIKNLTNRFSNVVIRHFRSPKGESNLQKKEYQIMSFEIEYLILQDLKLMEFDLCIWNRSHIGEGVYAPLYRDSNADWVFQQEQLYLTDINDTYLLLLTASPEFLSTRDDGKSFSSTVEAREKELELFRESCKKSSIKNFLEFQVDKDGEYLTEDFITNKIYEFITN